MKLLRPISLVLLCIAFVPSIVFADPLTYKIEGETVSIVSCDRDFSGDLIIPATIDGKSVTGIAAGAFNGCSSLNSVTIPNGVNLIHPVTFANCINLKRVIMPDSMKSIGRNSAAAPAFYRCISLTSIIIPASVTHLYPGAFNGCTNLAGFIFEGNAPYVETFNGLWRFPSNISSDASVIINVGASGYGEKFGGLSVKTFSALDVLIDGEYNKEKLNFYKTKPCAVSLFTNYSSGEIFYTLDNSQPSFTSISYSVPFELKESVALRAIAYSFDFTESFELEPIKINIGESYSLNINNQGGGSLKIDPAKESYAEGEEVTLTANPEQGYIFIGWSGDVNEIEAAITIKMNKEMTLTPTFGANVTVNVIGGGKVILTPPNPVPYGSTITFEAVPEKRHSFFRWAVDLVGNTNPAQLEFKPNIVVTALFAPSPVADKIKINTFSKSASPFSLSFESKSGSTYVIEASHDLKKWGGIGEAQGTGSSVKFTDWREALFQKQYYRLRLVE